MLCFRCGSPVSDAADRCDNCGQDLSTSAKPDARKFSALQKKLRETGRNWVHPEGAYQVGQVVAERYEIRDVVGVGALGTVFKALDQEFEVEVALKVMNNEVLPDEQTRQQFVQQLRPMRRLVHEDVVRCFDVDLDGESCFFVTQFLNGLTLGRIMRMRRAKAQRFSVDEVRPIAAQLCSALSATQHIMPHGGLKPDNIVILPDVLKVTDFGMADALPRQAFLDAQRRHKAAHRYLAPEIHAGKPVDPRSDVYSLAMILLELLAGEPHAVGQPVTLRDRAPEVPEAVDDVLRRAMDANMAARQTDAAVLHRELASSMDVPLPDGELEPPPAPDDVEDAPAPAEIDYSDPRVPPPQKGGSQITHQLDIDDLIEDSRQLDLSDEEELLSTQDEVFGEGTVRVDAEQILRQSNQGSSEGTQQIDADMIVDGDGVADEPEQVLLVPPGDINHSEVSGETSHVEAASEPSYPVAGVGGRRTRSDNAVKREARAREALQAFDLDTGRDGTETDQAKAGRAALAARLLKEDTSVDRPPMPVEDADLQPLASKPPVAPKPAGRPKPKVVTPEVSPAARGTLEIPAIEDDRRGAEPPLSTLVVGQGRPTAAATGGRSSDARTKTIPLIIVGFVVLLAAGTVGAILYYGHKRDAEARAALERKRVAAMLAVARPDAGAAQPVVADAGPRVAALSEPDASAAAPAAPDAASAATAANTPATTATPPKPAKVAKQPRKAVAHGRGATSAVARAKPRVRRVAAAPRPRVTPEPKESTPPPTKRAAAATASGSSNKCPRGMAHVKARGGGDGFCIDRFEAPGRGRRPQQVGLGGAKSACRARGLRLCSAKEWIRACGGLFPYGRTYQPKRCNTGGSAPVAAGVRRKCRSRWGVYDMSGNVAEWVADGVVMGGDATAEQGHAGCLARAGGATHTGYRCCGDPSWD